MSKIIENLLIAGALVLCALCAYQWHRETIYRARIARLTEEVQTGRISLSRLESATNGLAGQLNSLMSKAASLEATNKSLAQHLNTAEQALRKAEAETGGLKNQVTLYTGAVGERDAKFAELNQKYKELMSERNEIVKRMTETAARYNDVVKKYNDLAAAFEKGSLPLTK